MIKINIRGKVNTHTLLFSDKFNNFCFKYWYTKFKLIKFILKI